MPTKDQKMAQEAYARVSGRQGGGFADYSSFAFSFPSLIHACGLVQAVAFDRAKGKDDYIEDLEAVFNTVDHTDNLAQQSREAGLADYTRISRHALAAASWLKRYCQGMD